MHDYNVQGIYSEGGVIFCIIQDMTSLEFLRCDLEITGQDTVVLGTEMIAVTQTWTPKGPADPEPVPSLGGDAATASQDPASTLTTPAEPAAAPTPAAPPAGAGNFNADGTAEPAPAEPATTEPAAEPQVTEPVVEPAAEPADPAPAAAEPVGTEPVGTEPVGAEPTGEPSTDFTAQEPQVDPEGEPAAEPAPTTDFAALTAQVADLQAQLTASAEKVASLESSLSAYQTAENAVNEQKKQDLIATYSAILTEDEMKPVTEKIADLSVDDLEAKLAVVFARKQQAVMAQSQAVRTDVQLNIGAFSASSADDDLPNFMKEAMEIDRQRIAGITLKP